MSGANTPLIPDAYPELLADLVVQLGRQLEKTGIAAERAGAIAFAVAEHAREHWSGFPIYVPLDDQAAPEQSGDLFGGEHIGADPAASQSEDLYPALLADLARELTAHLVKEGIDELTARANGPRLSQYIRRHWGGQSIYIPRGVAYVSDERARRMFEKFRGNNHVQLAREFGVSVIWVYKTVARQRAKVIEKVQGKLF
jgi:Mor family transcriptional regulator